MIHQPRIFFKKTPDLQTGFSMLEAVVVVGVLLALAVGGFFAYGPITANAKTAAVKSAASQVYTAIMVSLVDGDPSTNSTDVVDQYNSSNTKLRAEIRAAEDGLPIAAMTTEGYVPTSDNDFCVKVITLATPSIYAEMGACSTTITGPSPSPTPTASESTAAPTPPPTYAYADATPTKTIMTYKCDVATTGVIPLVMSLTGTETWSDGTTRTYANAAAATSRTFAANTTYTMTFDGTYNQITADIAAAINLSKCLISVDHLGRDTGVKSLFRAFDNAQKLIDVPKDIPPTVISLERTFYYASVFNDPDVTNWNTSNIIFMGSMFYNAPIFNQPIDNWNTSKVTHMAFMFYAAKAFNQPLSKWDTSKAIDMSGMFRAAYAFNQPIGNWNTSNVTNMESMFNAATVFNQYLKTWNVSKVNNKETFRTGSALTPENAPTGF
jgi:surface protein